MSRKCFCSMSFPNLSLFLDLEHGIVGKVENIVRCSMQTGLVAGMVHHVLPSWSLNAALTQGFLALASLTDVNICIKCKHQQHVQLRLDQTLMTSYKLLVHHQSSLHFKIVQELRKFLFHSILFIINIILGESF